LEKKVEKGEGIEGRGEGNGERKRRGKRQSVFLSTATPCSTDFGYGPSSVLVCYAMAIASKKAEF